MRSGLPVARLTAVARLARVTLLLLVDRLLFGLLAGGGIFLGSQ